MMSARRVLGAAALVWAGASCSDDLVVVGSKAFTESYVLGEVAAQVAEEVVHGGVRRRLGMGSTGVLFAALKAGAIDLYPEYTGTLAAEIIKRPELTDDGELAAALGEAGFVMSGPLGFDNAYALAVRRDFAEAHALTRISDLQALWPGLKAVFSYEFAERPDGLRQMARAYGLPLAPEQAHSMDHSLAFAAIAEGTFDVIEVYSTDAKVAKYGLSVLHDDLHVFPTYRAVWVARAEFVAQQPAVWRALAAIEGRVSAAQMAAMNRDVELAGLPIAQVARSFVGLPAAAGPQWLGELLRRTREHLALVGISVLFAAVLGIALGVVAVYFRRAGQAIFLLTAVVQTIPSLALLCFLIPVFGVGERPAVVALCLYSLMPVIANTAAAIEGIDPGHLENAYAYGLSRLQTLYLVVLPLASPTILVGIKTATLVAIGTATLAALVGAGGYGAPIVAGLAINDMPTILSGAVPAAGMALCAHGLFAWLAGVVIPQALRPRPTAKALR